MDNMHLYTPYRGCAIRVFGRPGLWSFEVTQDERVLAFVTGPFALTYDARRAAEMLIDQQAESSDSALRALSGSL